MKLQIASDLHLERLEEQFPKYHGLDRGAADVLILPGDIHRDIQAANIFADWPVPVVFVMGNHEAYGHDIDVLHRSACNLIGPGAVVHSYSGGTLWKGAPTVRYLEESTYVQDDVRFLGCTLWTDYALMNPGATSAAMREAERLIRDHHVITLRKLPFTADAALARHVHNLAWLAAELDKPFAGKTVVVTHHAPHMKSIHAKYNGLSINNAFASNLEELILKYQPDLWVHGHVHDGFDYMIGKTRVVANPRGYATNQRNVEFPSEIIYENKTFKPNLIVEI